MSSAILYAAIVAIWAGILVPRWLRPRQPAFHAEAQSPAGGDQDEPGATEPQAEGAGLPGTPAPEQDDQLDAERHDLAASAQDEGPAADRAAGYPPGKEPAAPESVRRRDALPGRARVLRARRRVFGTVLALTAAAAGLEISRLAAAWVIALPVALLAGTLMLLREAAHSDTKRARQATQTASAVIPGGAGQPGQTAGEAAFAAAEPHPAGASVAQVAAQAAPGPFAQAGPEPFAQAGPEPFAQVIDISRRVGDQLYDQYTDAADRAVGD